MKISCATKPLFSKINFKINIYKERSLLNINDILKRKLVSVLKND